ncbi:MAG: hypothetical protein AVDCRST_MAG19-3761, partial [uncultured Thermomicrobiales bacterium]
DRRPLAPPPDPRAHRPPVPRRQGGAGGDGARLHPLPLRRDLSDQPGREHAAPVPRRPVPRDSDRADPAADHRPDPRHRRARERGRGPDAALPDAEADRPAADRAREAGRGPPRRPAGGAGGAGGDGVDRGPGGRALVPDRRRAARAGGLGDAGGGGGRHGPDLVRLPRGQPGRAAGVAGGDRLHLHLGEPARALPAGAAGGEHPALRAVGLRRPPRRPGRDDRQRHLPARLPHHRRRRLRPRRPARDVAAAADEPGV